MTLLETKTLDPQTIETVKKTAPIIKDHVQEIGKTFYGILFSRHPELYNVFNQSNQERGLQQEALAYGVYLAGMHIDNFEPIQPMITRVAEKHRALNVKPEQYPVVGAALIDAIKKVLGNTATEDIVTAWEKAYQYIADTFINIEQDMYQNTEQQFGGWVGTRLFFIDKKTKESDVITSFYLKPVDQQPIASYEPGQYLTIQAEIDGEEYYHMRHYTLSDAPNGEYYRISVKQEPAPHHGLPAGKVSNFLHEDMEEGSTLEVAAPAGDFTIKSADKPVVLLSGGVGITPMMSMLNTLVENQPEREVTFIHAAQNGKVHAMKDHVEGLSKQHDKLTTYFCYEKPTPEDITLDAHHREGFIDLSWLQEVLSDEHKDFYFCGPMPFLKAINQALKDWNVPEENRHFELFTPMSTIE